MSKIEFNAHEVAASTGFEPIPAGEYTALIEDTELKPTKKGDGSYIQLTFQVIEGEFKNRKLWARLNFTNPNATAQNIGRAELSAVCRAVGVMTPKDTSELCNKPLRIKVAIEKRSDNGENSNVIDRYIALDGAVSAPTAQAAQEAGKSSPPWMKK